MPDTIPGISRFQEVVLHQGRIERLFLDSLKEHSDIEVERGVMPESLDIDKSKVEDDDACPITVKLRHLDDAEATPAQSSGSKVSDGLFRSNLAKDDTDDMIRKSQGKEGTSEIVRAKYMIGCDGAHSWTRRQLGSAMEGEQTDFIWGVLDIIPITDFRESNFPVHLPQPRNSCALFHPSDLSIIHEPLSLTDDWLQRISDAGALFTARNLEV